MRLALLSAAATLFNLIIANTVCFYPETLARISELCNMWGIIIHPQGLMAVLLVPYVKLTPFPAGPTQFHVWLQIV